MWDLKAKKQIKVLSGLNEGVKQILISNNGAFIAASSNKNQLIVWNSKTLGLIHTKTFEKTLNLLSYDEDLIISVDKSLTELHYGNSNVPNENHFILPSTGLARNYTCSTLFSVSGYLIGDEGGEICIFEKGIFKAVYQAGKGKVSSIVVEGPMVYVLVGD